MRTLFIRKFVVQIIVAALLVAGIFWIVSHRTDPTQGQSRRGGGAVSVAVAQVVKGDVPLTLNALGTVTPLASVTVKTQIAGQLQQVAFTEGQMVKKGDFLAQIDPRPYQAQLDQYVGQLQRDQALLKEAEIDLKRYQTLVAEDSIARQQLDTQISLVQQDRGIVETDKAQVDNARLNLTYCHIVSPITGRVGLRQVDQGNYVQTSDANGLVIITQLQPITVVFNVPEDSIPALVKRYKSGATLPVVAYDRSGSTKLTEGKVLTIDNQIDTATGTVKVKAIFDNQDELLFPNQFVNITVKLDTLEGVAVVPNAAILRGAPGIFVYALQEENKVTVRTVKIGPADQTRTAILDGLAVGDKVVIDGTDKLRDGATVTIPDQADTDAPQPAKERKNRDHHE